jgi:hypothetical protein
MPIIKKRKKRVALSEGDKKKENSIQELVKEIADLGYLVRREPLKRGLGWRAQSGSCRLQEEKLILVDKRANMEEQLEFLEQQLRSLKGS